MKCYVCMMSLGVLNPYLEIKRQKEGPPGGTFKVPKDSGLEVRFCNCVFKRRLMNHSHST